MELGFLVTISCLLTAVLMTFLIGIILFFVRYGGQGVKMIFDRFLGGGDKDEVPEVTPGIGRTQAQQAVPSSHSLRTRAQQLDFPAPGQAGSGSSGFGAQAAASLDFPSPQQASLTPRGQSGFNAQNAPGGQSGNFQLSTPSLSPSRPFQAGSQFSPNTSQGQSFGQQPLQGNQYGQAQPGQSFGQQPLQGNQYGGNQQQPLQGNQYSQGQAGQASPTPQFRQQPLQGNQYSGNQQQPLQGNQYSQGQQGQSSQPPQFGQQPLQGNQYGQQAQGRPPNPPQGGLGQNRPPLQSRPRPGNTQYDRPIGGRDVRQGDDRDYIYDDRQRSGGGFVDDVGDFIDNF